MIGLILSLLNPLSRVAKRLTDAHLARQAAQTDRDRIAADVVISQLEAQQSVLLAEQGGRLTRWIRPAFAAPFVVYDTKILIWDKTLKLGATDNLSPEFWQLQMIVFGAYFLTRPFGRRP